MLSACYLYLNNDFFGKQVDSKIDKSYVHIKRLKLLRKFHTHLDICKFENSTSWAIENITADLAQIKIELNETKAELAKTKADLAQLNISQKSGEESVTVLQVKLAQTSSLFDVA